MVLARPERRNAQDLALLYALNDAFDRAAQDDDVRVERQHAARAEGARQRACRLAGRSCLK